jgi:serine/threonine protein kinase/flagellin-specific chaperone FliS
MGEKVHRNSLQPGYKLHWYTIKEILGQGGFGITYLAFDNNLEEDVAIKEFLPIELAMREGDFSIHPLSEGHKDNFEWGLDRFIKEARTLTKFKHPNVVRVRSVFNENNTAYMVMEFERGESLQEILSRRKTLDEAELMNIIIPLLGGLEVVHQSNFIHRDIKPANIFIREDGSPLLLDFGSARQALGEETKTLTSLVSPGYAPFEQYYSKSDEQGPFTDIYGFGATLYRAVTGLTPMDAVDRSRSILQSSTDTIVTSTEISKNNYSGRFLYAIDHAMKFKPEERPQTVAEWKREFELPDNPIREAKEIEKQITQPGTQAVAKKAAREAARKKPGKVTYMLVLLLLLFGAAYYYQDVLLNEQQQWQQDNEIESLLAAAQAEQPAGDTALANYRRVLELQANNAEARLGLQAITNQLTANASNQIKAGDFSAAEKTLAEAAAILPDAASIKLASEELAQAKVSLKNKLAKEKLRIEQLASVIKKAQTAADKGQVTETFSLIEQARILDADNIAIAEIKSRLRVALETQAALATSRAKQAMKDKDTKSARQSLQRAKQIKAQLNKLNLPEAEMVGTDHSTVLLNVAKAAATEGDFGVAIEKFNEAKSLGADAETISAFKAELVPILEEQAAAAAAGAKQAMKDKKRTLAKTALKRAKDIKAKLEQLK